MRKMIQNENLDILSQKYVALLMGKSGLPSDKKVTCFKLITRVNRLMSFLMICGDKIGVPNMIVDREIQLCLDALNQIRNSIKSKGIAD